MKLVLVQVSDLSELGGPMGSERTTLLDSTVCVDDEAAVKWALRFIEKNYPLEGGEKRTWPEMEGMSVKQKKKFLGDIGWIGFRFETKEVRGKLKEAP